MKCTECGCELCEYDSVDDQDRCEFCQDETSTFENGNG